MYMLWVERWKMTNYVIYCFNNTRKQVEVHYCFSILFCISYFIYDWFAICKACKVLKELFVISIENYCIVYMPQKRQLTELE